MKMFSFVDDFHGHKKLRHVPWYLSERVCITIEEFVQFQKGSMLSRFYFPLCICQGRFYDFLNEWADFQNVGRTGTRAPVEYLEV